MPKKCDMHRKERKDKKENIHKSKPKKKIHMKAYLCICSLLFSMCFNISF